MSFKKYIFSLLCIFAFSNIHAKSNYTDVPALIYISAENQPDTMGFNVAAELPKVIYQLVNDGLITLWDSPKKTIQITSDALKAIEKNTNTSFVNSNKVFVNELWTSTKKKFRFDIVGLSFMNEGKKGKVSYGYIDIEDAAPYLFSSYIKSNLNGSYSVSYMAALYSRRYVFTVVQFASKNFDDNIELQNRAQSEAQNSFKKQVTQVTLKDIKDVTYSIEKNPADKLGNGKMLFDGFEKLLYENLEVFFELGASKFFDFMTYRSEFSVTRIEVSEIWTKSGDNIEMSPYEITIFVNNKKLNPLSIEELRELKFNLELKSIEDLILEKNFDFKLVKINHSHIPVNDSNLYMDAMKEFSWTQLSRYVRFSKTN